MKERAKMKIVYICESLSNSGGIERIISSKANYFSDKLGYEVFIILTSNQKSNYFYNISNKINIINLNFKFSSIFDIFKYRNRIKILLKEIKPDVILVPSSREGVLLPLIDNKIYKIREVHFNKNGRKIQVENLDFINKLKAFLLDKLEEYSILKYNKLIVLTYEDKEFWNHKNKEVIYNMKTITSKQRADLSNKKAISVGRLDYEKGFDRLIKSWSILENKEWILEIYGDGPLKDELQKLIVDLKMDKRILLKGTTKNIKDKMLESSLYLLSSRHEGLPLVLLEAMECGLPIVSFDCPCGPKDLINDGYNGILVQNGDIKKFSLAIDELIFNDKKRMEIGINAKKESNKFEAEIIMSEWNRVLREKENGVRK